MDFSLSKIADYNEWNTFNSTSLDGSIYFDTRFLVSLNAPFTCYGVYDAKGRLLAGTCIIENELDKTAYILPFPFVPYQSILFYAGLNELNEHKKNTQKFRLTDFLINHLSQQYSNLCFSLKPTDFDLRPFLWHNYHDDDACKFSIMPRYTALLDLKNFDREYYLSNIRTARRQEIKKSTATITLSNDIDLFMFLYKKTFIRQDISIDEDKLLLIKRICEQAIKQEYGILTQAQLPDGVASMSLFLFDNQTGYYQFGANDPDYRSSGASAHLMFETICMLAKRGIELIDFVGVNSPSRGDYKLSFNPTLKPYYIVSLK